MTVSLPSNCVDPDAIHREEKDKTRRPNTLWGENMSLHIHTLGSFKTLPEKVTKSSISKNKEWKNPVFQGPDALVLLSSPSHLPGLLPWDFRAVIKAYCCSGLWLVNLAASKLLGSLLNTHQNKSIGSGLAGNRKVVPITPTEK